MVLLLDAQEDVLCRLQVVEITSKGPMEMPMLKPDHRNVGREGVKVHHGGLHKPKSWISTKPWSEHPATLTWQPVTWQQP